jgi:pimeloyl-ACP methyl ester carboxylesterase
MALTMGMRSAGALGTVGSVRAREPDRSGYAVRAGVRLHYEVFGDGPTTVVLLPAWSIVHSRQWKLQVPYLARYFRVLTYDPRGNGGSDRPAGSVAYGDDELVADAAAVMDEAGVDSAVVVGLSMGGRVLLRLAAERRERVLGALFVAPFLALEDHPPSTAFDRVLGTYDGWDRWNSNYWRQDLPGFSRWFFDEVFPEPHSTRQVDHSVEWALETDAETLIATQAPDRPQMTAAGTLHDAERVACPSLVVHGTDDRIVPIADGRTLADLLHCPFEEVVGGGHCVQARHPVWFNHRLHRFVEEVTSCAPVNPTSKVSSTATA